MSATRDGHTRTRCRVRVVPRICFAGNRSEEEMGNSGECRRVGVDEEKEEEDGDVSKVLRARDEGRRGQN